MKRPMLFYSAPDCGCGSSSSSSGSSSTGGFTFTGSTICHESYLALAKTSRVHLLGVVPGSKCQVYLDERPGGVAKPGFLVVDGSGDGVFIKKEPDFALPALTDDQKAVGWPYMMVATGSDAATPWQFVTAPSTGEHLLATQGGKFVIKPAGQLPGMNSVCSSETADTVYLTGCVRTAETGVFETKRLKAATNRVIVGVGPESGFKTLPDGEALIHPIMKPDTIKPKAYQQRDAIGNDVAGGIPVLPTSVTDAVAGMYSPTTKVFYRSPAPWHHSNTNNNTATLSRPSNFTALPGTHGVADAAAINYPTVEISGFVDLGAEENIDLAIYRGTTLIQAFDYGVVRGHAAVHYIDENVPAGTHVYSIRYRRGAGADPGSAGTIRQSTITVKTLR